MTPAGGLDFVKGHAYGNDFLLANHDDLPDGALGPLARAICHRHHGVGADGLIAYRRTATGASMVLRNADGVRKKFGVPPEPIPDYLALRGDTADGYPGLSGWGEKSTATVLARYGHLEAIPDSAGDWDVTPRGAATLARTLSEGRELAATFRELARLRTDVPVFDTVGQLRWTGPQPGFFDLCVSMNASGLYHRVERLARQRR